VKLVPDTGHRSDAPSRSAPRETRRVAPAISVVMPVFNAGRFVAEAIQSVLDQDFEDFELVIVDDGSTDGTGAIIERFAALDARVIPVSQHNQGIVPALDRAIGLARAPLLARMDADDVSLPGRLAAQHEHLIAHPEVAAVGGHVEIIDEAGRIVGRSFASVGPERVKREAERYSPLTHAAVMMRRAAVEQVGGYRPFYRIAQDLDLWLRLLDEGYLLDNINRFVLRYRHHESSVSTIHGREQAIEVVTARASSRMRRAGVRTEGLEQGEPDEGQLRSFPAPFAPCEAEIQEALLGPPEKADAERLSRLVAALSTTPSRGPCARASADLLARSVAGFIRNRSPLMGARVLLKAVRRDPVVPGRVAVRSLSRRGERLARRVRFALRPGLTARAERRLPLPARRLVRQLTGKPIPPGGVRFGDLRRTSPVDAHFGYDRGQPVDRRYIEDFLSRNQPDIRGHVLEIGGNTYTRMIGGSGVARASVLHVTEGNPLATHVADLANADHLPDSAFDCIIFTQTLHLIYDVHAAIRTLHRILKPGGVLLATVPGITPIDRGEWGGTWYWSFTEVSVRRMFAEVFGAELDVNTEGNVLTAIAFLHGLAAEELTPRDFSVKDDAFPVLVSVRARK
jgi:GT2 family glycosyltransferase